MNRIKKIWKMIKRPTNFIMTFGTLFLSLLFVLIIHLEMKNMQEKSKASYIQMIVNQVDKMIDTTEVDPEETYLERLQMNLDNGFETSASQFLYITKESSIIFVKDEDTTAGLTDYSISHYLTELKKQRGTYTIEELNTQYDYTVGVCVRNQYIDSRLGFDMMYVHVIMYGIIAAICFIIIVYYLQFVQVKDINKIDKLKDMLREKQLLLEKTSEGKSDTGEDTNFQGISNNKNDLIKYVDLDKIPKNQYKFNFYLNASHAIYIDGVRGEVHPHTWEIIIHVMKIYEGMVLFNQVEEKVEDFLKRYQGRNLNDFEPFLMKNPTLENLTGYFLEEFQKELNPLGWMIFMIEVAETPSRTYVVSLLDQ